MVTEPFVRGQFQQQQVRLRAVPLIALYMTGGASMRSGVVAKSPCSDSTASACRLCTRRATSAGMRAAASCDSLSDASTDMVNASVITKRTSQGLSVSHDQNSSLSRCGTAAKGECDEARSNQLFA